jgi:tape measure domain-containing protein
LATLRTAIQITDGMSPAFRAMNNAMNIVINSFESLQTASHNTVDTHSIQAARTELARAEVSINQVEQEIIAANSQQQRFNQSMRGGQVEAGGLARKVMGFVAAFAGMAAVKAGADMTDTYINQNSRLALINDGLQTQAELQQKIFAAAQRSRGEYGATVDTVAKLGLLAKDAFKGNDETIKFAELMNKSFRISGSSASEATNGMYQLTQAMASGRLQGDEFRSVMENAPMVAQAIATFTGKSMGQLKKMSADGEITADIIKNAMFSAADDINAKFETMPKTFGSVWTSMKNVAIMQFSSVMQKVNDYLNSNQGTVMINGISDAISAMIVVVGTLTNMIMGVTSFFSGNWSIIEPIIWGLVAVFIAFNAVSLITNGILAAQALMQGISAAATAMKTGATFAATAAQYGLNAALLACPITWIIIAIIALIVIFYAVIAAVNKFAGTSVSATGIIAGAFMTALAFIGNIFVTLINLVIDIIALIWNYIAAFAEFFANVFNDPIGSIVRLFSNMADSVLGIIEGIASALDTLFGSNLGDAVSGWRDQLQTMTTDLVGEAKIQVPRMDSTSMHLNRFEYGDAYKSGYDFGKGVEEKFDVSKLFGGGTSAEDQLKATTETAANTGAMKDSMKSSEEDMKYLRDIAEQEAINRFTTAEIKVDMTNHNNISKDLDLDGVVAHLEQKVYETMNIAAEGVHS